MMFLLRLTNHHSLLFPCSISLTTTGHWTLWNITYRDSPPSFIQPLTIPHSRVATAASSYTEYHSIVGDTVSLPCNSSHWTTSSPVSLSSSSSSSSQSTGVISGHSPSTSENPTRTREVTPIALVLWFKDQISTDTPLYTLDVRHTSNLARSRHVVSSIMKDRAHFDLTAKPPRLVIRNITKADQGLFRCRVSRNVSFSGRHEHWTNEQFE